MSVKAYIDNPITGVNEVRKIVDFLYENFDFSTFNEEFLVDKKSKTIGFLFPEIYLHPNSQINLVKKFQEMVKKFPNLTIVFFTNSAEMINLLDYKDIFFCRENECISYLDAIEDHGETYGISILLPGEMWSCISEYDYVKG